ncbi:MAG TPA: hypothetical protein VFR81_11230, partial [Longimicrobium sp.]|nr:hypothetical protein [Longimicrobium sp.]
MPCTPLAISGANFIVAPDVFWSTEATTVKGGITVSRTPTGLTVSDGGRLHNHPTAGETAYMFLGNGRFLLIM